MGQELILQLALRLKPAAFGIKGLIEPEVIPNALNAVRLTGHSQLLILGREGCPEGWAWSKNNPSCSHDEDLLAKVCEIIVAMQLKREKIEIWTTPDTPEERLKTGFCRIDLRLKK